MVTPSKCYVVSGRACSILSPIVYLHDIILLLCSCQESTFGLHLHGICKCEVCGFGVLVVMMLLLTR